MKKKNDFLELCRLLKFQNPTDKELEELESFNILPNDFIENLKKQKHTEITPI
jgi:hypothetical protein